MAYNDRNVMMEDVRIILRNFKGAEGQYNREGERNFGVILDEKTAHDMEEDGWGVRWLKSRNKEEPEQPFLPVSVNFSGRPPRIVMISSRGRTTLGEEDIDLLDWADIRTVDLVVRPYDWVVNGKSGTKAYLQSIFVTIEEDYLDLKYSEVEDVPARGRARD